MLRPNVVTSEQRIELMRNRAELRPWLRERDRLRPRTRAECWPVRLQLVEGHPDPDVRKHAPCPWVSCRHHLHVDVDRRGVITLMPGDLAHTCALDVIDAHPEGVSREEIAVILRVTEERTRIFERRCERLVREDGGLDEWAGHESHRALSIEEQA